jgi:hypothetical protein
MLDDLDLNAIQDENARQLIRRLLNLIEHLSADLRDAQAENQRLRDENNRLKGEQGQPKLKPNTPKPPPTDHSSEKERRQPRQRHKRSKKAVIEINREQPALSVRGVVEVDRATLPADAEFKGYEDVMVQDILLRTDNVCFHQQKYYAPSTGQTYLAHLPSGYAGQFGPGVKALTLALYFGMGVSEPKIVGFFQNVGIHISDGEVSNLLIKDQDGFHTEKAAVYPGLPARAGEAGLRSSPWQHTDDTQTRVNGHNQHCHVVCNPVYTAYHTQPTKERLAVLDVLRGGWERRFRLNAEALSLLQGVVLSQATRQRLQRERREVDRDAAMRPPGSRLRPRVGHAQRLR